MYPIINIFGREIGTYGLLAVLGLCVCCLVTTLLGKKYGLKFEDIILIFISASIGLLIGGHILYGITNIDLLISFFANPDNITFTSFLTTLVAAFGGMVFYGGFLGGLAAVAIHGHFIRKKVEPFVIFDLYAVSIPLFHFFGRIGCFLGGCCYGIESEFGFTAHDNPVSPGVNDISRFPVQLLEASLNLLLFLLILQLFRKEKFKGNLVFVYMFCYSIIRFGTEFLRGDEVRKFFLCFSTSQWISIILFAVVIVKIIITLKKNVRSKNLKETP